MEIRRISERESHLREIYPSASLAPSPRGNSFFH
nr:MAG TPA: hypothetical protein [Caudoviricetes sp.]